MENKILILFLSLSIGLGYTQKKIRVTEKPIESKIDKATNKFQNDTLVKIFFNVFPDTIKSSDVRNDQEVFAQVTHTNLNHEILNLPKDLEWGPRNANIGPDYLEVLDPKGDEIVLGPFTDPQIMFDPASYELLEERINLKKGESKTETIYISDWYTFNRKGTYKIRYISSIPNVNSNWDTLTVK